MILLDFSVLHKTQLRDNARGMFSFDPSCSAQSRNFSARFWPLRKAAAFTFASASLLLLFRPAQVSSWGQVAAKTHSTLKEVAPGQFELDGVQLNKRLRTVEFEAKINMTEGLVEYLVVHTRGKVHESVLQTDIDPYKIHVALLLIGVTSTNQPKAEALSGPATEIEITWNNGAKRLRAEELIWNKQSETPMSRGPWFYNGSQTENAVFAAQSEGSIVSIIDDPLALANNPRPGRDNDEIWLVNTNTIPPKNTNVRVLMRLKDEIIRTPPPTNASPLTRRMKEASPAPR